MSTPTGWDTLRRKAKGDHGERTAPRCSRCERVSVLDPCRRCANPAEEREYPPSPGDPDTRCARCGKLTRGAQKRCECPGGPR